VNISDVRSLRIGSGTPEGILFIGLGMAVFVIQDAVMKALLGPCSPVWQLIIDRSQLAALDLIPAILVMGSPHRLLSPCTPSRFNDGIPRHSDSIVLGIVARSGT
jgi:hypothetical protein